MMEKTYHVPLRRFARIYLLYPLFFYAFFYLSGMSSEENLNSTIISTLISILISNAVFKRFARKAWVLTLHDTTLESFSFLGERRSVAYSELIGPMEVNLVLIKFYLYSHKSDHKKYMVITDMVEHIDEILATIEDKLE